MHGQTDLALPEIDSRLRGVAAFQQHVCGLCNMNNYKPWAKQKTFSNSAVHNSEAKSVVIKTAGNEKM